MKFLDQAKVYIRSGGGGPGCISVRRAKFIAFGGPNGGDVGRAIGNLVDLRLMSHERFAERPARIPTIPRLNPG